MSIELPDLLVPDREAWRDWLARNHGHARGIWLLLAKQGASAPTSLRYDAALEEALCVGWIDGQVRRRDERVYAQRFTPRRPGSAWSARNVGIAERLIADGRMTTAGSEQVERARADGRWQRAYAGAATIAVPADLAAALAATPSAASAFAQLTSQNRYAILYRLATAKRPETRTRRLAGFVAMLSRGETIYPQRAAPAGSDDGGGGGSTSIAT